MSRHLLVSGIAVIALAGGMSGCSGSDDKPEAAKTTATTVAPTTPAPTPTTPAQPQGADGATYKIQNWDEHSTNPAVLGWKQANEALAASTNQGKVLPSLRNSANKVVLRKYVAAVNYSSKRDLKVPATGDVKVVSAVIDGRTAKLKTCLWAPTTSVRDKGSDEAGSKFWFKQTVEMRLSAGRWIVTSQVTKGKCGGGAPR